MDAPGRCIYMSEVAVYIGAFQLAPLAVFLDEFKEPHQFRLVLGAPFFQHLHGGIVRRLLVLLRFLHDGQTEVFVEILLECGSGRIRADCHSARDTVDFLPDLRNLLIGFLLPFKHEVAVNRYAVVFHKPTVHCGRRFQFFHDDSVLREKTVKPVIELEIQPQGIVGVGAGVTQSLMLLGIHLIKVSARRHRFKRRHIRAEQRGCEELQTAVMKVSELPLRFERKL